MEVCRDNSNYSDNIPDYVRVIITTDSHGRQRKLFIPANLDLERPKRPRTVFKPYQIEALEHEFQNNHFLLDEKRIRLASTLGLTELQVKIWFQNRRTKAKKLEISS